MAINALENLPEHLIDHAALGVKSQTALDTRYLKLTGGTLTGDLDLGVRMIQFRLGGMEFWNADKTEFWGYIGNTSGADTIYIMGIDYGADLSFVSLTADRTFTFPNASGTLALLETAFVIDTKANILATTPSHAKVGLATDTDEFYFYDTNDSGWKVAPLELKADNANPDMGAYDMKQAGYLGLGVSDHSGYYDDWITDKSLSNIKLLQSVIDEEGSIRTTTSGVFQVYLNGVWNDVVINFRLREDNSGAYEFEHMPIGFTEWIEIMSGNSDKLDLDGRPMLLQYSSSMGAYQVPLLLEGGQF